MDSKRSDESITKKGKVEVLQKLKCGVSVHHLCEAYGLRSSAVYDIKKQWEKLKQFLTDSESEKCAYKNNERWKKYRS